MEYAEYLPGLLMNEIGITFMDKLMDLVNQSIG
jgi:hypothetical protein